MSDAIAELIWGDGPQRFRLPIGQLRELQDKCDAGPARILSRLGSIDWKIDDIRETLRLGLIGGGMVPSAAYTLVKRYIDDRDGGLMESRQHAQIILMKALVGDPSDPVGEQEKAETPPNPTPESSSATSSPGGPS